MRFPFFPLGCPKGSLQDRILQITDDNLRERATSLQDLISSRWADSTNQKYSYAWDAWVIWCSENEESTILPADPFFVCLYFNDLVRNKAPLGRLEAAYLGIRWKHLMSGFPSPTEEELVKTVFEGGKRILARFKTSNQKEPLPIPLLQEIADSFGEDESLIVQRFIVISLLCFTGFLRISELLDLQVSQVTFLSGRMEIFLPKSKTDQFRQGNIVFISDNQQGLSTRFYLERYLKRAKLSDLPDAYIICRLYKTKNGHRADGSSPLSYNAARENFLKYLKILTKGQVDVKRFGTHSMRSGGATAASNNGISEREIDLHGRWKPGSQSRNRYIKDSTIKRLKISRSLGI